MSPVSIFWKQLFEFRRAYLHRLHFAICVRCSKIGSDASIYSMYGVIVDNSIDCTTCLLKQYCNSCIGNMLLVTSYMSLVFQRVASRFGEQSLELNLYFEFSFVILDS